MPTDTERRLASLRRHLPKLRALRQITRDAPDQLRREAAIIACSRTLDGLIDDLTALDNAGLLEAVAVRLDRGAGR